MSITILVIDDEPIIAAGLSEKIDWGRVGCRIVGTATNGSDGLRLIDELAPDIVISDIVMPGCSGIELAERCNQEYPYVKLILLSAHSEFEYAQQAIRLNVVDYVLKPIDSDKLIQAVKKAVKIINEQKQVSSQMSKLESAVADVKQYISSSVLFEIARYGAEGLPDGREGFAHEILARPGIVLCVKLYNIPRSTADEAWLAARELFQLQMKNDSVETYSENRGEEFVLLCCLPPGIDSEIGRNRIVKSAELAVDSVRNSIYGGVNSKLVCVCIVSATYRNIEELKTRYRNCLGSVSASFFFTRSGTMPAENEILVSLDDVSINSVLHHLIHGNTKQMAVALREVMASLKATKDCDRASSLLKELYRNASGTASKAGMSLRPVGTSMYVQENFEQKSLEVGEYLMAVCKYIETSNDFVGRMELLVEENYRNRSFSLMTAADMMGISSSYLSRLFKQKNGQNFLDYLLDTRISHAKYLLETTTLRNRQIAERVGFEGDHYFGQVFKKYCGVTPKQYRDAMRKTEGQPPTSE